MASKPLMLLVALLVFACGFVARLVYEQTLRPAQAQDDPRAGLDCGDYDSQADAQATLGQAEELRKALVKLGKGLGEGA